MKKLLYAMFPLLMLVGFTACNREIDNPDTPDGPVVPEVPALQFTDVSLTLDAGMEGDETSPDTKSVVNIAVEDIFNGAALFAFSHATGNILTYDDGTPVICTTASKSFSWQLPMYDSGNPNSELDIYTLVNYSGNLPTVEAMLTNPSLTKADLDALTFTCGSSSALQALYTSSYGLPMEATNTGVRLTPGNNTLSISAKRLFAKYQFYYDTSDFTSNGYTVNGLYVYACKSNTVVPVFTEGYGQTNLSYVQTVDFGTATDLTNLQYGDSAHAITLYFLENCQGTKSGCSHFWEVASSGLSGLNLCSYIDVGVKVTDPSGNDMNFFYWIYLGSGSGACVTDFNVSRNYSKTLKLMLRRPTTPGYNPPVKSLTFVDAYSTVAANYPSTGSLYFETNMGQAELTASVATNSGNNSDASAVVTTYNAYNAHNATGLPYSGIITVTPNADKTMLATVTAGLFQGSSWVASDERTVSFTGSGPTITFDHWEYGNVSVSISAGQTSFPYSGGSTSLSASATYQRRAVYSDSSVGSWEGSYSGTPTITTDSEDDTFSRSGTSVSVSSNSVASTKYATYRASYTIDETYTDSSTDSDYDTVKLVQSAYTPSDEFDHFEYENLSVTVSVSPSDVSSAANNYTVTVSQATATRYEYWTLSGKKTGTATTVYGTPDVWTTGDSAFTDIDETFYGNRPGSVGANSSASSRSATYHASYQFAPGYVASGSDTITQAGHTATVTWRLEPSSLSFSPSSITVGGNATCTTSLIKRKYEDNVATSVTDTPSLSWDTDDSSVATVSNGIVTGTGAGSATITATDSSCEAGYQTASGGITVVSYKSGFTWLDSKITIDAGGSATASFACSSSSPSFSANDDEITIGEFSVNHTASNGYEYSGSVTIYASNDMYNGDEGIITGSAGGGSDNLDFVIHKESYTISISASKTTLLPDGETVTLTITSPSSSSWTLSDDEGYFSFSKTSGTGNASVSATIGANEYSSARSTDVYVRLDNGKASDFVRLTQNASSITVVQIDVWIRSTYRYGKYYTYAETSENVPCGITVTDSRGQTYVIEEYDSVSSDEYQWPTEWGDVRTCIAASVSPSSYTTPDGKTKYTFVPDV